MVEEMYLEEAKEHENTMASSDGVSHLDESNGRPIQNPSSTDEKPTPDQLTRLDSECLSSIISNPGRNDATKSAKTFQNHHHRHHQPEHNFGSFGAVEFDFSSYNQHVGMAGVSYANDHRSANQNFNGGGGGGGDGDCFFTTLSLLLLLPNFFLLLVQMLPPF
uniref:Uncharacterized protein MANES_01G058700 n=1 Tax=Rhizophora mucronata TaxID=61149 RepID=A0A2P2MRL2_RHIMU